MEAITITEDARRALVSLLNKSLEVEYDLILNYPRMIEKLENTDKIHDEQLNNDLQRLGRDSIRHFNDLDNLVVKLGGEPHWRFGVIARLDDVQEMLTEQLGKEKEAISLYEQAKLVVNKNKIKVKVGSFLDRLVKRVDGLPEDFVTADEIMAVMERQLIDEKRHVRLCEDSIATLKMLKGKGA